MVSSARSSRAEALATSSIASRNAASFAFDGFVKPLIFLTNCSDAARTSSSVTGGSKLKSVFIFLHMEMALAVKMPKRLKQPAAPLYLNNGGLAGLQSAHLRKAQRRGKAKELAKPWGRLALEKATAKRRESAC